MKKIIFVIFFIVLSGFLFGLNTPDAKAFSLDYAVEGFLQTIQSVQVRITELMQKFLVKLRQEPYPDKIEVVIRLNPIDKEKILSSGILEGKPGAIGILQSETAKMQEPIKGVVENMDGRVINSFWLSNALLVEIEERHLENIKTRKDVWGIHTNFELTILPTKFPLEEEIDLTLLSTEGVTWGLDRIGAPRAWNELGATGSGIRVAVLDTGVDISHPDLAGRMWTDNSIDPSYPGGWIEFDEKGNIVKGSTPYDSSSHGTHCSGTILGGNASGIAIGVAPDAWLMHGLVLNQTKGTFTQVVAGMQWAINPFDQNGNPAGEPADIVSMSLGATGYYDAMIEPVQNIRSAGIVPMISIGNSGSGSSGSPGNVYDSFGIGATDVNNNVASFSSGEIIDWPASHPEPYIKPDFSAPGVFVYSTVPGNKYGSYSGTSMAAPHAAGTAALILGANSDLTVDEIYDLLKDTATWQNIYYDEKPCTRYGWGIINAFEAVSIASLNSGIEGTIRDAETKESLSGARIFISETGSTRQVNISGYYKFFLSPGTYTLTTSVFGYYNSTEIVVVNSDNFTLQDFMLQPKPGGTITGIVTDSETGKPIEGAIITLLNTSIRTTTNKLGQYSFSVPIGIYDLKGEAWGYLPPVIINKEVFENEEAVVNFSLDPALAKVAILGDYDYQLTNFLRANSIYGETRGWDVINNISRYDTIIINHIFSDPGESTFLYLLEEASNNKVNIIFTGSIRQILTSGLSLMQKYLNDPDELFSDYGQKDVYYEVVDSHPIFSGWKIGDKITILDSGYRSHLWFFNYSGKTLANIGSQYMGRRGDGVAINEYGDSYHLILSSLALYDITDMSCWTDDAKTIFMRAVLILSNSMKIFTTELSSGKVGVDYLDAVQSTPGFQPYTWSIIAGSLPPGLSLDAGTGVISGIPTSAGVFEFRVQVIDNNGNIGKQKLYIIIETVSDIYELIGKFQGAGSGTVNINPPDIDYKSDFSRKYGAGDTITLTVTPDHNSYFAGWSGDCSGTVACTLVMDKDKSITVNLNTAPECTNYNGHTYCRGFRSTDPQGSSCQAACLARGYSCPTGDNMFRSLSEVAEIATTLGLLIPGESYNSVQSSGYYSPYVRKTLTSGAKTIHYDANWNQNCIQAPLTTDTQTTIKICRCEGESHKLSVNKDGTSSGTVISSPSGIDCGSTCSAFYSQGTTVELTVLPDFNSVFAGWSGACSGTGRCIIEINENKSVTATFNVPEEEECTIHNGYIYCRGFKSTDPQGASCNAACSARDFVCLDGDTMFRSAHDAAEVAIKLGLLMPGEKRGGTGSNSYRTPHVRKNLSTGEKTIFYPIDWTQSCTFNPFTDSNYERVNICRCEEAPPSEGLSVNSAPVTGITIVSATGHSGITKYTKNPVPGTSVSLTAPKTNTLEGVNYEFVSWSGAGCSSSENTASFSMIDGMSCTANYKVTHALTVTSPPVVGVPIDSSRGYSGITNYIKDIQSGLLVSLSAPETYTSGDITYEFVNWTGTYFSPTRHLGFYIKEDIVCNANYKSSFPTHMLSVKSSPFTGIAINSTTGHSGTTNYGQNLMPDTLVSLTAPETYDNYNFSSWSGCDSVSNRTCYLSMNKNRTVTVNYSLSAAHTFSVTKSGTGSGTVISNPAGINCGTTCSANYEHNTTVTLTATPDPDSTFTGWSGACTGTTCTVTMDSNKSVTATFDAINIIDCAKEYGQEYWCSSYEDWELECQRKGDVKDLPQETFCKDELGDIYDKCVTCWVPTHTLSVNSSPVTGINITSATGHSGTTDYSKTIEEGTSVSLTAPSNHVIPGSNIAYDFVSWSGTGCSSENTTVNLEMTSDIICTANYKKSITTHTLSISSTANGSVINPGQGNFSYNQGETVSLLAVADLGYRFINWTGDTNTISNTEHSQTTITIEGDYSITANFKQTPECTTYNGNTYCRGFKSTDPQGSSCQAACSARGYSCPTGDNMFRSLLEVSQVAVELGLLGYGESYHSRASAFYYSPYIRTALSSGDRYIFYDSGWNQSCTNAPLSSATYERIKICLCQESLPSYTLSVSKSGTGSGTVTSEPQGISCGTTCSAFFDQATYVTLTATADSNSTFKGWSGDCTGTTCTIEMKSNKSATAVFDIIESPPLPQGCINYKGYIYCRGFKSTDPQGSSCHAACSARGYSCPTGDNMLRSVLEVNEAAVLLGLLASRERYGLGERASHYSPYIRKTLTTGAKHIYYDPNWNQSCSHAPLSDSNYERIKICRCQQVSSPQALTYVDNQLASLNNIVSNLIDQLRGLIGKQ